MDSPASPPPEPPALPGPAVSAEIQPAAVESPPPLVPEPPILPTPAWASFTFHGNAREYFRIWIVNTLLTLLTCGVFAAWAKVRKRRYLRSNTELLGHCFDYRADPRRILLGNVIMVVLFLGYGLFGSVYPTIRLLSLGLAALLLPWIVVRSLSFNAHNTVYRGMRFRFKQNFAEALMTYLIKPLLIPLTLGLYYPAWVNQRRTFTIGNHRLGDTFFRLEAPNNIFYGAYVLGGLLVVVCSVAGTGWAALVSPGDNPSPDLGDLAPFFIVYGVGLFVAKHYIHASLFNHVWNHTRLNDHRFQARMSVGRWLGLQAGNLGAVVLSCGLLYPWATIRTVRYSLACVQFLPASPIDKISRVGGRDGSATGDSAAELLGLDIGL